MPRFIEWRREMSVEDPVLDAQHQQVLNVINDLFDAISADRTSVKDLKGLLLRLQVFTETHFHCEETYMKHAACPFRLEHGEMHKAMAQKTRLLAGDLECGKLYPGDLLRLLKDWWLMHILKSDMEYIPYVSRIGL